MSSDTLENLQRNMLGETQTYPLHRLVWQNDYDKLDNELRRKEHDIEEIDPRGRTPLHLAVSLGFVESTRVLLRHKASVNAVNTSGWTVWHEAVSTGDPEMVVIVLQHRNYQRAVSRNSGITQLLEQLRAAPDFYVEMKWQFSSWVPFMSRMCPSDTYKVYKSGANVRIDMTLLDFDQMSWKRGNRSFIFKGESQSSPGHAWLLEVDHDAQKVYREAIQLQEDIDLSHMTPSAESIASRLMSPIITNCLDMDKISFNRSKSGMWGWRSHKTETVSDYSCKVFAASNIELVTKQRIEHLGDTDKQKHKDAFKTPIQSFLGMVDQQEEQAAAAVVADVDVSHQSGMANPTDIRPEEYFDPEVDLGGRDIGRPKEVTAKSQKFRGTLWLCDDYPLSLKEQVLPIIDLIAMNNAQFAKLRDFITLQLPAGFPVKIEVPLYHVLSALVTFGNLNGAQSPVTGVVPIVDSALADLSVPVEEGGVAAPDDAFASCAVDASCFDVPSGYRVLTSTAGQRPPPTDEYDRLLQYAIQQSLADSQPADPQQEVLMSMDNLGLDDSNVPWEEEDKLIQRAIQESLASLRGPEGVADATSGSEQERGMDSQGGDDDPVGVTARGQMSDWDLQLRMALELSEKENRDAEQRQREEDEELQKILQLSLTEQ